MQRISRQGRHGEGGEDRYQSPFSQRISDRHAELIGDDGRVQGRLTNRSTIVRIERSLRDHTLPIGEQQGPWPAWGQIAYAPMRAQVLNSLGTPALFEISRRRDQDPVKIR